MRTILRLVRWFGKVLDRDGLGWSTMGTAVRDAAARPRTTTWPGDGSVPVGLELFRRQDARELAQVDLTVVRLQLDQGLLVRALFEDEGNVPNGGDVIGVDVIRPGVLFIDRLDDGIGH